MNPRLDALLASIKLKAGVDEKDHTTVNMLAQLVADSTSLAGLAATGADVTKELDIVYATGLNLADHVRQVAFTEIMAFLQNAVTGVLIKVISV